MKMTDISKSKGYVSKSTSFYTHILLDNIPRDTNPYSVFGSDFFFFCKFKTFFLKHHTSSFSCYCLNIASSNLLGPFVGPEWPISPHFLQLHIEDSIIDPENCIPIIEIIDNNMVYCYLYYCNRSEEAR